MTYCKHFIEGIKQINFPKESASAVRSSLLLSAYQTLTNEKALLTQHVASLPANVQDNVSGDTLLQEYKVKKHAELHSIEDQLEKLKKEDPARDWEAPLEITPAFIQEFSTNFRSIPHLAEILSDAPLEIKKHQTALYANVLLNLRKNDLANSLFCIINERLGLEKPLAFYAPPVPKYKALGGRALNLEELKLERALHQVKELRIDPSEAPAPKPKVKKSAVAAAASSKKAGVPALNLSKVASQQSAPNSARSEASLSPPDSQRSSFSLGSQQIPLLPIFPLGDKKYPFEEGEHKSNAEHVIVQQLLAEFRKPVIEIDADGNINMAFCFWDEDVLDSKDILNIIIRSGGFNQSAYTMVTHIVTEIENGFKKTVLSGKTLDEIARKLAALPQAQQQEFVPMFKEVRETILMNQLADIADLKLTQTDELTLRKLLELSIATEHIQSLAPELDAAFKLIEQAKFQDALAIPNIEQTLDATLLKIPSPFEHLVKEMVEKGQTALITPLLNTIQTINPDFTRQVEQQGLLHFALEKGETDLAQQLVEALTKAGMDPAGLFTLMMKKYGPKENQPHIKWATNAFHIAIRNNSLPQLRLVLSALPNTRQYDFEIFQALHLCATFGNEKLFREIVNAYNLLHPKSMITVDKILTMPFPPDDITSYHQFLKDEKTNSAIEWGELEKAENAALSREFLLNPPKNTHEYPLLIALANANYAGFKAVLDLAYNLKFSEAEWQTLFRQKDGKGKNILNYLLEQNQLDRLAQLLPFITQQIGKEDGMGVYVDLISNPNPVNPIQNFLNAPGALATKFSVLNALLDGMCRDFAKASPAEQKARIVTLLVNQSWLTEQALYQENHAELRNVLQNDALSAAHKQALFAALREDSPANSKAKEFFTALLEEVSPRVARSDQARISLELPDIFKQAAMQQNDIQALLKALSKQSLSVIHSRNAELTQQVKSLELELSKAQPQLASQHVLVEQLKMQLREATKNLAEAQADSAAIHDQLARQDKTHALKVVGFEQRIRKLEPLQAAHDELLKLKQKLEAENAAHIKLVAQLKSKLEASTHSSEQLTVQLGEIRILQGASEGKVSALSSQLEEFQKKNTQLEQRLATYQGVETDNQELVLALKEQMAALAVAREQAASMGTVLDELRKSHLAIEAQKEELVSKNQTLTATVSTLQGQVFDLTGKLQAATTSLQEQVIKTTGIEDQLVVTKGSLAEAQNANLKLLEEARRDQLEREQAVAALVVDHSQAIEAATLRSTEALKALAANHIDEMRPLQSRVEQSEALVEELRAQLVNQASLNHSQDLEQAIELERLQNAVSASAQQHLQTVSELRTALESNQAKEELITQLRATHQEALNLAHSEAEATISRLNAEHQNQLAPLQAQLSQSQNTINQLTAQLEEQLVEVRATASAATSAQAKTQSQLDRTLEELRAQRALLEQTQREHEAALQAIKKERQVAIDSLTAKHAEVTNALQFRLKNSESQVEALSTEVRQYKDQISRQEAAAGELSETLAKLMRENKSLAQIIQSKDLENSAEKARLQEALKQQESELRGAADRENAAKQPAKPQPHGKQAKPPSEEISPAKASAQAPTQKSASTQTVLMSSMRIYALLRSKEDGMEHRNEHLDPNSDDEVILTVNMPTMLTEKELHDFRTETGLNVTAPSGHKYSFSYKDEIPKAVLTEQGCGKNSAEFAIKYQERLAATVINMMDNILSKGTVININTKDPLVAKVAEQYLSHLKTVNLEITEASINLKEPQDPVTKTAKETLAVQIFAKFKAQQLSEPHIKNSVWYKEAVELRNQMEDTSATTQAGKRVL